MAKLKIRIYPDPALAQKTAPHTTFGPADQQLFDDMIETMYASDGVGLAAPQAGILKRIFVCCPSMKRGEEFVMVNPRIESSSGEAVDAEGCLSLPGISADITRATTLELTYQNRYGNLCRTTAKDFFARVIQHEMDHLNGKLLIDHFSGRKREELLKQYDLAKAAEKTGKPRT
jgi:peptide deformylase